MRSNGGLPFAFLGDFLVMFGLAIAPLGDYCLVFKVLFFFKFMETIKKRHIGRVACTDGYGCGSKMVKTRFEEHCHPMVLSIF